MIEGLFLGWILSYFGFINVVKEGMLQIFKIEISDTTYYFLFAIFGLISCGLFGSKKEISEVCMEEIRCNKCNKLLAKVSEKDSKVEIEIKCPRCGQLVNTNDYIIGIAGEEIKAYSLVEIRNDNKVYNAKV